MCAARAGGPATIKGLPAVGKSNADTLFKGDSGFGHLEGLGFASEGDKMQAVVTTTVRLKHWLRGYGEDGMPQEIGAAFKSDRFYYYAIQDSAFAKYAELPIAKPAGTSAAVAVLGVRGNGDLKGPLHEIDVVAIQGEKVFFIAASDAAKTVEIPACEKVWTQMMARSIDNKDPRGDMTHEDIAMTAFTLCFAKERQARAGSQRSSTRRRASWSCCRCPNAIILLLEPYSVARRAMVQECAIGNCTFSCRRDQGRSSAILPQVRIDEVVGTQCSDSATPVELDRDEGVALRLEPNG